MTTTVVVNFNHNQIIISGSIKHFIFSFFFVYSPIFTYFFIRKTKKGRHKISKPTRSPTKKTTRSNSIVLLSKKASRSRRGCSEQTASGRCVSRVTKTETSWKKMENILAGFEPAFLVYHLSALVLLIQLRLNSDTLSAQSPWDWEQKARVQRESVLIPGLLVFSAYPIICGMQSKYKK